MIHVLKFKHTPESKVFFYSDFHYNHDPKWEVPLWKARGFNSVEEHDKGLIERWNNKIDNNSICFHLGDICFGKDGEQKLQYLFNTLNFKELYLQFGNHHSGIKQWFDKNFDYGIDKYYRLTFRGSELNADKLVHIIPNYYEVYVNSTPIVLSHYPVKCWNGHAHSSFMCHGHVHGSYHDSLPTTLDKGKILDCGPESVKEPLSFDEVKSIMDKKSILSESHHSREGKTPFC